MTRHLTDTLNLKLRRHSPPPARAERRPSIYLQSQHEHERNQRAERSPGRPVDAERGEFPWADSPLTDLELTLPGPLRLRSRPHPGARGQGRQPLAHHPAARHGGLGEGQLGRLHAPGAPDGQGRGDEAELGRLQWISSTCVSWQDIMAEELVLFSFLSGRFLANSRRRRKRAVRHVSLIVSLARACFTKSGISRTPCSLLTRCLRKK